MKDCEEPNNSFNISDEQMKKITDIKMKRMLASDGQPTEYLTNSFESPIVAWDYKIAEKALYCEPDVANGMITSFEKVLTKALLRPEIGKEVAQAFLYLEDFIERYDAEFSQQQQIKRGDYTL